MELIMQALATQENTISILWHAVEMFHSPIWETRLQSSLEICMIANAIFGAKSKMSYFYFRRCESVYHNAVKQGLKIDLIAWHLFTLTKIQFDTDQDENFKHIQELLNYCRQDGNPALGKRITFVLF
jgi:hypothetical protein